MGMKGEKEKRREAGQHLPSWYQGTGLHYHIKDFQLPHLDPVPTLDVG